MNNNLVTSSLKWSQPLSCLLALGLSISVEAQNAVTWGTVPSPNRGQKENILKGITAASANDIWAVGEFSPGTPPTARRTLIEHWDGAAWTIVPSPNPNWSGLDLATLEAASRVSANDVWAVGYSQDLGSLRSNTLTEHWNGTQWRGVPSPNPAGLNQPNQLFDVVAIASDNVWAVGGQKSSPVPLILHWTGSNWNTVANRCSTFGNLNGVTAVSPSDIWAVGDGFSCHYDGTSWNAVAIPLSGLGADSLFDVSGTGSTDVWAVGDSVYCSPDGGCSANPYVIHWNGSKWDLVPGAPGVILNGVLAQTSTDVYVVGTYSLGTAIGHWDGRSWSKLPSPDLGEGGGLNGIAATGPNQFWSVGSFLDTTFRGRTLIEQAPSTTQGALIGGTQYAQATVTWIGPENGSTTSDIFGNYQAAGLPVGDYTVIVSAQGCSPGNASVKISAGETMIQNFHLQCH